MDKRDIDRAAQLAHMKPEYIQRLLEDGKRYEKLRRESQDTPLPWYIQATVLFLVVSGLCQLLGGGS